MKKCEISQSCRECCKEVWDFRISMKNSIGEGNFVEMFNTSLLYSKPLAHTYTHKNNEKVSHLTSAFSVLF